MMRRSIPKSTTKRLYEMHAQVCKVLANAKRIEVIDLLREGEKTAGELIEKMGISKANLSQQLAVMLGKGVLTARRQGRSVSYRLAYPGMLKAYDMLRLVLLDRLEDQAALAERWRGAQRRTGGVR